MYKLFIFLTAAAIGAGLPRQLADQSHLATDSQRLGKIYPQDRAGEKSQSNKEAIQELATILSSSKVSNKTVSKGKEKLSEGHIMESQSRKHSLMDTIRGLLKAESQSQQTTHIQHYGSGCLRRSIVNNIKRGEDDQYIILRNKYIEHNIYRRTNSFEWISVYQTIRNVVKSEDREFYKEVWLTYAPDHNAIHVLTTSVFEDYSTKPTFYIAHLAPPNAELTSGIKRISCLQSLVNQGYIIKEWDWVIFSRLTGIPECDYYTDSSADIELEPRLFESSYLNNMKPNSNLGHFCSTV